MVIISEQGPQLLEADIVAIEKYIGSSLPEQYRRFLLKNNGGRPTPDTIKVDGLAGGATDIQLFYGIGLPLETSNIVWKWEMCSGRIPEWLLPIACDSGGWAFCISLSGSNRGSVLLCVLSFYEDDGTIYFIANNYDEFLEKIEPFTPVPNGSHLN